VNGLLVEHWSVHAIDVGIISYCRLPFYLPVVLSQGWTIENDFL